MTHSNEATLKHIDDLVKNNAVVLFIKGSASMPMCGFSAVVVQILNELDVPFLDVNVLENEALRQGIKEYTDWPTIPQLYVNGEFIGGCDIVREMYQNGDLTAIFEKQKVANQG